MAGLAAGQRDVVDHLANPGIICIGGGDKTAPQVGIEFFKHLPTFNTFGESKQGLLNVLNERIRGLRRNRHRAGGNRIGSSDDLQTIGQVAFGGGLADRPGIKLLADNLLGDCVVIAVIAIFLEIVEMDPRPGQHIARDEIA